MLQMGGLCFFVSLLSGELVVEHLLAHPSLPKCARLFQRGCRGTHLCLLSIEPEEKVMIIAGGIKFKVQEDPHSLNIDSVPGTIVDAGKYTSASQSLPCSGDCPTYTQCHSIRGG